MERENDAGPAAATLKTRSLALIGAGAMGEAIISGLLTQQLFRAEQITAAEPRAARRDELQTHYNIRTSASNHAVAAQGDIVVVAVKPQVLPQVLPPLRGVLREGTLCISIAAGVPIQTIAEGLGHAAVVRSIPNTPAQINQGMTVWTAAPAVSEQQRTWARLVLGALGRELFVEREHFIDMATALAGSGPAYIFLIIEAMIDAGVQMGFARQDAEALVLQTMHGSVQYAMQSGEHPARLRNAVTSPGGTTAAALAALERGGLRTVLSDAIQAAYQRSRELGKPERHDET